MAEGVCVLESECNENVQIGLYMANCEMMGDRKEVWTTRERLLKEWRGRAIS